MNNRSFKKHFQLAPLIMMSILFTFSQFTLAQDTGYWDDRFAASYFGKEEFVEAIAVTDNGEIFIGGDRTINGSFDSILKWDGTIWTPWGGKSNLMDVLLPFGDYLYAGGLFSKVDGNIPANSVARYNFITKSWSALGEGANHGVAYDVNALALDGDDLYVGGSFTLAGGKPANNIAKWNAKTNQWQTLGEGVDGTVNAIAIRGKEVYVGGGFRFAGSVPVNRIAKWDGQQWAALDRGVDGKILALVFCGDDLYAGGIFSKANGLSANTIARWSLTNKSWSALGDTSQTKYCSGRVNALASDDRVVYAGGYFCTTSPSKFYHIAKWDPIKKTWSRLGNDLNNSPFNIQIRGREVYVGGLFTHAGDKPSNLFAIWHAPAPSPNRAPVWTKIPDVVFQEDGSTILGLKEFVSDVDDDLEYLDFNAKVMSGDNDLQVRTRKYTYGPSYYVTASFASKNNAPGLYSVEFTATDPLGLSASDTIQVTVTPVNDAPLWSPLPNLTFREDGRNRLELPKYVSDVDDSLSALSLKAEVIGKQVSGNKWQKTSALQVTINPATKIANFKASADSFGVFKVAFMVTDPGQLADTTTMHVRVKPSNDAPVIANLPETITFRNTASKRLLMWDFVSDVDDADSTLHFSFAASNDSLKRKFDAQTGVLILTAPGFIGKANLFLTVRDDSNAVARDTIAVHVDRTVSVAESSSEIPTEFVLLQNYPNPFNPTTLIRFGLPQASEVKLEVFDLSGQRVATLLNERKNAGFHAVEFNASNLSSGTYFYRLTAGSFGEIKKLLLVK